MIIVVLLFLMGFMYASFKNKECDLKEQIELLDDSNLSLKDQVKLLNDSNLYLKEQIDSVSTINTSLNGEISNLNRQISQLNKSLNEKQIEKKELEEKIKDIKPVNDTIKTFIQLDSVNNIIIRDFEKIVAIKDSIITKKAMRIQNDSLIINNYKKMILQRDAIIDNYDKSLKKEKTKKAIWQTTTGIAIGVIITILIL